MKKLKELVGQSRVKTRLEDSLKSLNTHAFVFAGPKGIGKHTFAAVFSAALLCDSAEDIKPCGKCRSCICFRENTHPDYKEILPVSGDKTIKTDTIRKNLVEDIGMYPQLSTWKVYYISADYLNEQSQNVLLKTLEEPSPYAVIILSVSDLKKLLPTVLSRTVSVKFDRYPADEIKQILKSKGFKDGKELETVSLLCEGIPGAALNMLENSDSFEIRQELHKLLFEFIGSHASDIFIKYYPFFNNNKDRMDEIFLYMISFFRDLSVFSLRNKNSKLINMDIKNNIKDFYSKNDIQRSNMLECVKICEQAKKSIDANTNFEICVCAMLLRIRREFQNAQSSGSQI